MTANERSALDSKLYMAAALLDRFLNDGKEGEDRATGFILAVFPFDLNESGTTYVSNADPAEVKQRIAELAALEGVENGESSRAG